VETVLYRVLLEGITNITKHAAATHVQLHLWQDARTVHARLHDGVGFAVDQVVGGNASRGLGLLGIRERLDALGGTLRITSVPGRGTTLQIAMPVDAGAAPTRAEGVWADPCLTASADLPPDPLTSREREILQRIAEGQTTKEIASHLGLSVKTIESHRARLMDKLDIHETATLVRYAIRRGLTAP
jgi:DNA-binding CsgD family transcriptional regulator